jgi:tetratricopeptide (TPR) repeat protein
MPLDPYGSCPCGSGKKFKWCCQPIHVEIDRAFEQDAEGQHEAALRLMEQVVAQHPANPEAWGRRAQLLYQNDRVEEAEKSLDRALEVNPNYPFGHLLRGMFRHHEGEVVGALLLFRKAAELYDPEARDILAQVYGTIAEAELRLNHPVACHAAIRISLRCLPNQPELQQNLDNIFGPTSRLPASARQEYRFKSPAPTLSGERRRAWDQALATAGSPRLSDAARAFDALTQQDAEDAAAWYNLGLARAWLGDNPGAVQALDRYVGLEADEEAAGAAWALAEVLRCGQGMEEQADYLEHSVLYQVRDPQKLVSFLQEWHQGGKLAGVVVNQEEGVINGVVLDAGPVLTATPSPGQLARLGAYLLVVGGLLRLWHSSKDALEKTRREVEQFFGGALSEPQPAVKNAAFGDVVTEAMAFPAGKMSEEEAKQRIAEHAQRFYEETWVHRPLRALNLIPPADAAGSPALRKKLRGVVQFLQECAAASPVSGYDFDRLRRQLGLAAGAPAEAAAGPDIGALSAADLTALEMESLSDAQLTQAWQTAQKHGADELAGAFARALVARPVCPEQPDRFPWYSFLAQRALAEGKTDEALSLVSEGERVDAEANEGRRRNDYEQRRAQVYVKRGEADQAHDTYARLIERVPAELRYRTSAAEAMLSLRQGPRARRFAEEGLVKARQQNNRDAEQQLLELVEAAKKQGG